MAHWVHFCLVRTYFDGGLAASSKRTVAHSPQQPILAQPSSIVFSEELKIIPKWAIVLAAVAFTCMQVVFNFVIPHQKGGGNPPDYVLALLGVITGSVLAVYFLLIGYVNRDSGRRGMSRTLWTIIVMLVPNALGFILYFLVRQPAMQQCPQCHAQVQTTFNYCPTCNTKLHPHCAQCQRMVRLTDTYCPYCGYKLEDINH